MHCCKSLWRCKGEGRIGTYGGGLGGGGGAEISNQGEGRFIPNLPITTMKTPSSRRRNTACRIWWKSVNCRLISLDWAFRVLQGSHLFWFWKAFITALLRLMWQAIWKLCFILVSQVPSSCVVLEVRAETFASQGDWRIWAENYVLIYWKHEGGSLHFIVCSQLHWVWTIRSLMNISSK